MSCKCCNKKSDIENRGVYIRKLEHCYRLPVVSVFAFISSNQSPGLYVWFYNITITICIEQKRVEEQGLSKGE